MRKITIAVAATIVASMAAPAQAGDVKFSFERWMLGSDEGTHSVYERLERVTKRACTFMPGANSHQLKEECRDDLMTQLVTKIDNPKLTLLHLEGGAVRYAKLQ